jgi:hypothetical protein
MGLKRQCAQGNLSKLLLQRAIGQMNLVKIIFAIAQLSQIMGFFTAKLQKLPKK